MKSPSEDFSADSTSISSAGSDRSEMGRKRAIPRRVIPQERRSDFSIAKCLPVFGKYGTASSAECNNQTLSPSFLVLKGIETISLGKSDSTEENDKDYMIQEATERWAKRVHTRISFGSVSYQYREEEEKTSCAQSLGVEQNVYSAGSVVSQTVDTQPIPQAALDIACEDSQIINADRFLPPNHSAVADHLNHRRFEEALVIMEEILRIDTETYGEDDLIVAIGIHNLAVVNMLAGHSTEALYYFHEAVLTKRENLQADNALIAESLVEIGILLYAREEFSRALSVFKDAMECFGSDLLGLADMGASNVLNNIGCVHFAMGNYDLALSYLKKSLAINKMSMGTARQAESALLNFALTASNVGRVKIEQNNCADALTLLEEALLVHQSVLGDDNITVKSTIQKIAACRAADVHSDHDES